MCKLKMQESGEVEFRSTNYTSFGSYLKATMKSYAQVFKRPLRPVITHCEFITRARFARIRHTSESHYQNSKLWYNIAYVPSHENE